MSDLKAVLLSEIESFREKGHKFLGGELSMMDFKHTSGGMGVYAQRGGKEFMIRLRTPSGIIKPSEFKLIYQWAKKYKLETLHFTTRQAIQYHGMNIDDVCELMKEALDNDIYTRGAGGNFPRNVALSPLAGVDVSEPFDPTPYAVAVGNYFMERIISYKLPRKLKVSVSNTEEDTAHCSIQDLGFIAVNKDGEKYFRVYLGGGLGRNPRLALVYPELIRAEEILYYVEGMVKLFVAEGNYENKAKARVRYIVEKLGEENFITEFKKYVDDAKNIGGLNLNFNDEIQTKQGIEIDNDNTRLYSQKQKGLYSVYLHPVGGQISLIDLKEIIEALDKCEDPEIRLSMTEGVYFRNLNGHEAKNILEITEPMGGKTPFEYSVACIGVPTCQMGIGNSQETLNEMIYYLKKSSDKLDLLPRIYFSGCGNSCGVHEIGAIGFTGKKKRVNDVVQEVYEIYINGSFEANEARLGKCYGDILKSDIPEFILVLNKFLQKNSKNFEEFIKSSEDEFKEFLSKYLC